MNKRPNRLAFFEAFDPFSAKEDTICLTLTFHDPVRLSASRSLFFRLSQKTDRGFPPGRGQ